MEQIIKDFYYDPETGFVDENKLYKKIKENGLPDSKNITLNDVKKVLAKQYVHQIHKPIKLYKEHYSHIVSPSVRNNYQMDLLDMSNYAKWNKGYKWLMNTIDVFSRYVFCVPMVSKDVSSVLTAFKQTIDHMGKCKNLNTDLENAVMGKQFQTYLQKLQINHHAVNPEMKKNNSIVERFNRTIRSKIIQYMESRNTKKWIDVIDKLATNYNNTYHRTIKQSPQQVWLNEVSPENGTFQWTRDDIQIGDDVRILKNYNLFIKKTDVNDWTKQIYKVIDIIGKRFKVQNKNKANDIRNKLGYEIQKIDKTVDEFSKKLDDAEDFTKVTKERNLDRFLKSVGIDASNEIINTKRVRSKKTKNAINKKEDIEKILDEKKDTWLIKWKKYPNNEATWETKASVKSLLGKQLYDQLVDAYSFLRKNV